MTSSPAGNAGALRFPGLDGTRALGALLVLTTHVGFQSGAALNGPFNGVLSRMDSGVAIFFVISGFLLARPHFVAWVSGSAPPASRTYLWHRVLRILPALWITVIAAWVLLRREDASWVPYARHAALVQIYSRGNGTTGLTQMWSLSVEVAFYLLLPVLGWVLSRGPATRRGLGVRLAILAVTPLAGAAWMAWSAAVAHPLSALWLPGFLGWFGLGMMLALWSAGASAGLVDARPSAAIVRHRRTVWALAGAVYLVATSVVAGPYSLKAPTPGEAATKSLLYAAFGLLVVLPSAIELLPRPAVAGTGAVMGRVASFLGDISYGIFCYHLIVLGLVERATGHQVFGGGFLTLWPLTVAGTVLVAAVSFYAVERPVMRRGRGSRRRPAEDDATGHAASATASSTSH
ncbi:Acyltransferase 3 [Phycicoccus elongatus Lp2]|uniref:Acyltransferase 3 n=1 Tax=Phycicoccus elongatus Lp2 TaxID=1193181 RepID=N0DY36_9MICO|nr:acyltransferase [Phycicoccus elongatus]CCH69163.1 Acyltransferase 3 [Phycicoccus elongatus Lp2]